MDAHVIQLTNVEEAEWESFQTAVNEIHDGDRMANIRKPSSPPPKAPGPDDILPFDPNTSEFTSTSRNPIIVALNSLNTTEDFCFGIESSQHLSSSFKDAAPAKGRKQSYKVTVSPDSTMQLTREFTLVNGYGNDKLRKPAAKRGCCGCKPIAALVLTMTALLALIVASLVFLTEYPHMGATVQ